MFSTIGFDYYKLKNYKKTNNHMKNIIILILVVISFSTFAQKEFEHDIIIDSLESNSYELFIKSQYVATTGLMSKIRYLDEKNKIIHVQKYATPRVLGDHVQYQYNLILLVKDNMARVIINNVQCTDKKYKYSNLPITTVFLADNKELETRNTKKNYQKLMLKLKNLIDEDMKSIEKNMHKEISAMDLQW